MILTIPTLLKHKMLLNYQWMSLITLPIQDRFLLPVLLIVSMVLSVLPAAVAHAAIPCFEDYSYRRKITIGSAPGAGTNYPIKFIVYADIAPYDEQSAVSAGIIELNAHSQNFPFDIRFTDSDSETELDYWIESADLHFAEAGKGQPLGATYIYPAAECYNNKSYIIWQAENFDVYINCYDHSTGAWEGEIKVDSGVLSHDDHGAPSLIVDSLGYIHVFYGSHYGPLIHSKSTYAEDISSWTTEPSIGNEITYPRPVLTGDTNIYLFYRGGTPSHSYEAYRKSSDDYSIEYKMVDLYDGVFYHGYMTNPEYDADNRRVHVSFIRCLDTGGGLYFRKNLYHAYLDLDNGHMYTMNGFDLGPTGSIAPIDLSNANSHCLIVSTGENYSNAPTLHLDRNGFPHIIYPASDVTEGRVHFYYIKWNGNTWIAPTVITAAGKWTNPSCMEDWFSNAIFNYSDFIINSTLDIEAYLAISDDSTRAGDSIEKWRYDGSTWLKEKTILSNTASPRNTVLDKSDETYRLNSPQIVRNYSYNGPRVIFSEVPAVGYPEGKDDWSADKRIFAIAADDHFLPKNDAAARFWVEVQDDLSSSDEDIFIYYGKSYASDNSSITATFIKGDDGVSGNYTTFTTGDASLSHARGVYYTNEDSTDDSFVIGTILSSWNKFNEIRRVSTFSGTGSCLIFGLMDEDNVLELIDTQENTLNKGRFYIIRYTGDSGIESDSIAILYKATDGIYYSWTGSAWDSEAILTFSASGILEFKIWDDGAKLYANVLSNGNTVIDVPASVDINSVKPFSEGICLALCEPSIDFYNASGYIDDFFVRKYISQQPSLEICEETDESNFDEGDDNGEYTGAGDSAGSDGGGCFIATACYGS